MTRNGTLTISARWTALAIASRFTAAILGGYVFACGFAALGSMSLVGFGMARSEAVISATMLAFVVYLVVAMWAFAARHAGHVWLTLAGGGSFMTILAHWLAGSR